jgi:hypothetical protein
VFAELYYDLAQRHETWIKKLTDKLTEAEHHWYESVEDNAVLRVCVEHAIDTLQELRSQWDNIDDENKKEVLFFLWEELDNHLREVDKAAPNPVPAEETEVE